MSSVPTEKLLHNSVDTFQPTPRIRMYTRKRKRKKEIKETNYIIHYGKCAYLWLGGESHPWGWSCRCVPDTSTVPRLRVVPMSCIWSGSHSQGIRWRDSRHRARGRASRPCTWKESKLRCMDMGVKKAQWMNRSPYSRVTTVAVTRHASL